ncbi:MAG: hypothetical protein KatS3mg003_0682 [Candidatus Nitrosocaldaceae archaeon]|nr:MAG: hypothetical protein KatS3mg003_0682 [Candidatus Nitrosocaldaceae archaeon]
MNLIELTKINDEKKAEEWLRDKGMLKRFDRCIYCNNEHIGKVRRNYYNQREVEGSNPSRSIN